MNRSEATSFLTELFSSTPATPNQISMAIDASRVVDSEGRGPADDGYVETIDQWWAAAELATTLATTAMQDSTVIEFSSEGSRFKTAAPNWWGLAAHYRSKSPLVTTPTGIGVIELDTEPRHIPRSSQATLDGDTWEPWSEEA